MASVLSWIFFILAVADSCCSHASAMSGLLRSNSLSRDAIVVSAPVKLKSRRRRAAKVIFHTCTQLTHTAAAGSRKGRGRQSGGEEGRKGEARDAQDEARRRGRGREESQAKYVLC